MLLITEEDGCALEMAKHQLENPSFFDPCEPQSWKTH